MYKQTLRSIEEGVCSDLIRSRQRKYARAKTIRRVCKNCYLTAICVLVASVALHGASRALDARLARSIGGDSCGGLEYLHDIWGLLPVLYLQNATTVWFPSYQANTSAARIRTIEQSVLCPSKTTRFRHADIAVKGLLSKPVRLSGKLALCAAHRIDYMKYGNCSF
jgi:hypothetical protein